MSGEQMNKREDKARFEIAERLLRNKNNKKRGVHSIAPADY